MSKVFRADGSLLHFLQMIVPDGRSRLKSGGNISSLNDFSLLTAVRPDSGEAVGLQFEVN